MPLNDKGYEVPDPRPVEMPSRLRLPQNRTDQIRAFIRSEMSRQAQEQGHETFEDADDFDMDEVDFTSAYEVDFDPPAAPEPPPHSPSVPVPPAAAAPVPPPVSGKEG